MAALIACVFKPNDPAVRKESPASSVALAPASPARLPRIEEPSRLENAARQRRPPPPPPQPPRDYSHSSPTTQQSARCCAPQPRKASKFWFLKPGALPATVAEGSPYHTIHVASTSRNGNGASPRKSAEQPARSSSAKRRRKKNMVAQQQAIAQPPPATTTKARRAFE